LNFTTSEENYLKAIFHLQEKEGTVTTNALAEKLQTKPASVTDMMKKLNAKKLLHYKPYYGFSLSTEGKKIALFVVRRHRLWEYFLSEKLKFSWDEVHQVAEQLEHVSSKKLIDKLDEYLDHPRFDPHGDPIPNSLGKMENSSFVCLTDLPLNKMATVSRVVNQSAEMLELLADKKIGISTKLEIKKRFSYDGSLEIKLKQQTAFTISKQLAENIFVTYGS